MRINREAFLQRLLSVQSGLATRETIEQASCYAFLDGRVYCFNGEVCCSVPSKLGKQFRGAVKAKPLYDQLQMWSEDEIDLEPTETLLIVEGLRKKWECPLEAEVQLSVEMVEQPTEWLELPEEIGRAHV